MSSADLLADGPYNNGNSPAFIVIELCSDGIGGQSTITSPDAPGSTNYFNPVSPAVPLMQTNVFDIGLDIDADGTIDRWLSQEPATFLADGIVNSPTIQYGNTGWVNAYFYQLSEYVGHKMRIMIVDRSTNYYMAVKSIRINGVDGVIVPNALTNGFFEEGLKGWTVLESSVTNHDALIYRDKTGTNYITHGTNFFTTRIDPASTDSTATAVIESDVFVLPPITSFIMGNVQGGVSEFVNNPGANGSDNLSGLYIDLGTTNQPPNGKYDPGYDLPLTGFYPGPAGSQDRGMNSVFINTSGLEGRQAQVVAFDNSAVWSVAVDGFRMNWDWEESIIKNGGFDQGIPNPKTDPSATDWFMELGDGTLTAASHPSGSIPNWTVKKAPGATADAYFFDKSADIRQMTGQTYVGTGAGDVTGTGVEIRSDVFTITPIPASSNSVFVQFAAASATDRTRYADDGSAEYQGLAELIVDVNTNGIFGDAGDFHYIQRDQGMYANHNTAGHEHDSWQFPAYRFYIKPEHQGLQAKFHALDTFGLNGDGQKDSWGWIAIDDLFVWDGAQARLAFPNSDFEMGSLTNWTATITSDAWQKDADGNPYWTNWLAGTLAEYEAGKVSHLVLNDHASYFDGNFAVDSGPNEVPGADGDGATGDITSIAFTLPKLASVTATSTLLRIVDTAGVLTLSWTGTGVLQTTTSLTNGFAAVTNATSPYQVPTDSPARFYRLRLTPQ